MTEKERQAYEEAYASLTRAANEHAERAMPPPIFTDRERELILAERYRGRADVYLRLASNGTALFRERETPPVCAKCKALAELKEATRGQ